ASFVARCCSVGGGGGGSTAAVCFADFFADPPPAAWIEENLPAGAKLGYSPWLHTVDGAERLSKACAAAGGSLVALTDNPLDALWTERPAPPLGASALHDRRDAGEEAAAKLARVREAVGKRADALVVSDPQAVSWLFNIRGHDVPHTPVVLAYAILQMFGGPMIYVDSRKLGSAVREKLEALATLRPPADFE